MLAELKSLDMYAIKVERTGGPEVLSYTETSQPSPAAGEVLIKAEVIGVNFVDTYFRSGLYPHERPFVLGAEVAGTVAAVGEGVTALRVGDRVATSATRGGHQGRCNHFAFDHARPHRHAPRRRRRTRAYTADRTCSPRGRNAHPAGRSCVLNPDRYMTDTDRWSVGKLRRRWCCEAHQSSIFPTSSMYQILSDEPPRATIPSCAKAVQ